MYEHLLTMENLVHEKTPRMVDGNGVATTMDSAVELQRALVRCDGLPIAVSEHGWMQ